MKAYSLISLSALSSLFPSLARAEVVAINLGDGYTGATAYASIDYDVDSASDIWNNVGATGGATGGALVNLTGTASALSISNTTNSNGGFANGDAADFTSAD